MGVREDDSEAIRLGKILKGRIDGGLFSPGIYAFKKVIQSNPKFNINDFEVIPKPLTADPNHFAFSKKLNKSGFIKRFNQALAKKMASGEVQKIIDRY